MKVLPETNTITICPSSKCEEGAQLIGIVKEDGHVDIMKHPLPIDKQFMDKVKENEQAAEERFRFAGTCIKSGCAQ